MDTQRLIEVLGLEPHPEGGHFRRTWTGPTGPDGRAAGSAIQYLLAAGERSHWHRIDAEEIWVFNAGDPLELSIADPRGGTIEHTLGADVLAGQRTQVVVAAHTWQSAVPRGDWSLVTCVVVPGFEFDRFELAPPGWSPG